MVSIVITWFVVQAQVDELRVPTTSKPPPEVGVIRVGMIVEVHSAADAELPVNNKDTLHNNSATNRVLFIFFSYKILLFN